MLWLIGFALIYVPFLYNPNALKLSTVCRDLADWRTWVSRDGLNGASWQSWWAHSAPQANAYGCVAICGRAIMCAVYGYIAFFVHAGSNMSKGGVPDFFSAVSVWQLSLGAVFVLPAAVLAAFDANASAAHRHVRPWLLATVWGFVAVWYVAATQSVELVSVRIVEDSWAGAAASSLYAVNTTFNHAISIHFWLAALSAALSVMQVATALASSRAVARKRRSLACCNLRPPAFLPFVCFFRRSSLHYVSPRLLLIASYIDAGALERGAPRPLRSSSRARLCSVRVADVSALRALAPRLPELCAGKLL